MGEFSRDWIEGAGYEPPYILEESMPPPLVRWVRLTPVTSPGRITGMSETQRQETWFLAVTTEAKDEYSTGAGPGHNPSTGRLPENAGEVARTAQDLLADDTRSNWELPWRVTRVETVAAQHDFLVHTHEHPVMPGEALQHSHAHPHTREPEVHVDWRMTPAEWQELAGALASSHGPYLSRLRAEGKLPEAGS